MEIEILQVLGAPEGAILSVRAGGARRQAPVTAIGNGRSPFRFPTGAGGVNPFKVDLLKPVGSARLALRPGVGCYTATLRGAGGDGGDVSVDFAVCEKGMVPPARALSVPVDEDQSSSFKGIQDEYSPLDAAIAKEYLERHNLLPFVRALLQTVIRDRPSDPFGFIEEQFRNTKKFVPTEVYQPPAREEAKPIWPVELAHAIPADSAEDAKVVVPRVALAEEGNVVVPREAPEVGEIVGLECNFKVTQSLTEATSERAVKTDNPCSVTPRPIAKPRHTSSFVPRFLRGQAALDTDSVGAEPTQVASPLDLKSFAGELARTLPSVNDADSRPVSPAVAALRDLARGIDLSDLEALTFEELMQLQARAIEAMRLLQLRKTEQLASGMDKVNVDNNDGKVVARTEIAEGCHDDETEQDGVFPSIDETHELERVKEMARNALEQVFACDDNTDEEAAKEAARKALERCFFEVDEEEQAKDIPQNASNQLFSTFEEADELEHVKEVARNALEQLFGCDDEEDVEATKEVARKAFLEHCFLDVDEEEQAKNAARSALQQLFTYIEERDELERAKEVARSALEQLFTGDGDDDIEAAKEVGRRALEQCFLEVDEEEQAKDAARGALQQLFSCVEENDELERAKEVARNALEQLFSCDGDDDIEAAKEVARRALEQCFLEVDEEEQAKDAARTALQQLFSCVEETDELERAKEVARNALEQLFAYEDTDVEEAKEAARNALHLLFSGVENNVENAHESNRDTSDRLFASRDQSDDVVVKEVAPNLLEQCPSEQEELEAAKRAARHALDKLLCCSDEAEELEIAKRAAQKALLQLFAAENAEEIEDEMFQLLACPSKDAKGLEQAGAAARKAMSRLFHEEDGDLKRRTDDAEALARKELLRSFSVDIGSHCAIEQAKAAARRSLLTLLGSDEESVATDSELVEEQRQTPAIATHMYSEGAPKLQQERFACGSGAAVASPGENGSEDEEDEDIDELLAKAQRSLSPAFISEPGYRADRITDGQKDYSSTPGKLTAVEDQPMEIAPALLEARSTEGLGSVMATVLDNSNDDEDEDDMDEILAKAQSSLSNALLPQISSGVARRVEEADPTSVYSNLMAQKKLMAAVNAKLKEEVRILSVHLKQLGK